jgi:hypothetical protein
MTLFNKSKKCIVLRIFLFGCFLFCSSFLVYAFFDDRSIIDSYYGACMLISLQGQDDTVECDTAKVLISFLSLCSGLVYMVSMWTCGERYLTDERHHVNVNKTVLLGIIIGLSTLLIYLFVESRTFVDSFYGMCMLLSLQGQDERPDTTTGKFLIGLLSIISSGLFGIMAWLVLEHYVKRDFDNADFEMIDEKNGQDVDYLLFTDIQTNPNILGNIQ